MSILTAPPAPVNTTPVFAVGPYPQEDNTVEIHPADAVSIEEVEEAWELIAESIGMTGAEMREWDAAHSTGITDLDIYPAGAWS
jgi:hypothetical protein